MSLHWEVLCPAIVLGLVSSWPVAAQVAFFVVSHDLYIYWFHRLQHRHPLLSRLHEAHYSVGASPEVPLIKGAIGAVWGIWIHANVDVRSGVLQWVLNGPEAHRWHHAVDAAAHNRNFATKLALWDRLFGTAYLPADRKPFGYGLGDEPFPRGYLRQQAHAFRSFGAPEARQADGA